ncbi:hypothetical protein N9F24_02170 [Akkermansiaceae bacterium]|nr:hypothetical protein [Akkermansiaceae bacterium]
MMQKDKISRMIRCPDITPITDKRTFAETRLGIYENWNSLLALFSNRIVKCSKILIVPAEVKPTASGTIGIVTHPLQCHRIRHLLLRVFFLDDLKQVLAHPLRQRLRIRVVLDHRKLALP